MPAVLPPFLGASYFTQARLQALQHICSNFFDALCFQDQHAFLVKFGLCTFFFGCSFFLFLLAAHHDRSFLGRVLQERISGMPRGYVIVVQLKVGILFITELPTSARAVALPRPGMGGFKVTAQNEIRDTTCACQKCRLCFLPLVHIRRLSTLVKVSP